MTAMDKIPALRKQAKRFLTKSAALPDEVKAELLESLASYDEKQLTMLLTALVIEDERRAERYAALEKGLRKLALEFRKENERVLGKFEELVLKAKMGKS